MSRYCFRTDGAIPLDAFSVFGINAKPRSGGHPIGFFGTGLKMAIAVILRHGGRIQVFIDGVEYEFYIQSKNFRGKDFQGLRMRKRHGLTRKWRSIALPYTTELGKTWALWEAYRELESNTRDEGGTSFALEGAEEDGDDWSPRPKGTDIVVTCPGFSEIATSEDDPVFLNYDRLERVGSWRSWHSDLCDVYDRKSDWIYYRGIRVYKLRYPSKLTYDMAQGRVELSEDRSAKNIWSIQYDLSRYIQQDLSDEDLMTRMLELVKGELSFETDDLSYTHGGSSHLFKEVTGNLDTDGRLGHAGRSFVRLSEEEEVAYSEEKFAVRATASEWQNLLDHLEQTDEDEEFTDLCDRIQEAIDAH